MFLWKWTLSSEEMLLCCQCLRRLVSIDAGVHVQLNYTSLKIAANNDGIGKRYRCECVHFVSVVVHSMVMTMIEWFLRFCQSWFAFFVRSSPIWIVFGNLINQTKDEKKSAINSNESFVRTNKKPFCGSGTNSISDFQFSTHGVFLKMKFTIK